MTLPDDTVEDVTSSGCGSYDGNVLMSLFVHGLVCTPLQAPGIIVVARFFDSGFVNTDDLEALFQELYQLLAPLAPLFDVDGCIDVGLNRLRMLPPVAKDLQIILNRRN